MHVENYTHICHIMLYHFEKCWQAEESFRDLNELFGEGTISKSQVERWFKKFKTSEINSTGEEGRGRPGPSSARGRKRNPDNKNASPRLQCQPSHDCSSSQKARKKN